ncbi:MAG: TetR/AcrR family transcriptional regulator [Pseudomonadota bacterium]
MNKIRPEARAAIIEAAFAVYAERPTASLADVAARAGVGRATLHRHFPGRADLMRELAGVAMQELDRAVEAATADAKTAGDVLRLALHAIVPLANRQWFLAHEDVDADPVVADAYNASREELKAWVEAAKNEGLFAPDVPSEWIVEAYEQLTYAAWSQLRSGEATSKQAAEIAWRTLTRGLKGDM